ncbi:protein-L-isoaspartate(D-aspartate) O-methyltransferase [Sphingosinicella rhizophila]|uniref:Protein-L-isoaspartate O-methyltransferase n=1 Tax=Sphingosinicella rhizophila TaxID=3050082 RepID=A0ABU3Q517_9SPHN|nr:protein-L-isoaspartate(D-aspartate) O-methyltransferase [Sphingosinicella sp. GR2756]MDT9598382.1 protein-L-isoaspartate(D-aspartate) O-methyltransferase [Sphingosinicella sp. GR2756]
MADFAAEREKMVTRQIVARGILDPQILEAFRAVPREEFVSGDVREFAYEDSPLPIESDQTISQPYIVALMIEAAGISAGDRVLEIGAGSGYAAAVMGQIAGKVVAIERHADLARLAHERMERLGYGNVSIRQGDGTGGLPEEGPYDAIIASASGSHVPDLLLRQLAIDGVLVMPIGEPQSVQKLVKLRRIGPEDYEQEDLGPVRFVPLIGAHGWDGHDRGSPTLPDLLRSAAEPLPEIDDPAFGEMFDRFADARLVLLGEASHGTSEFYRARAAISKRLIDRHGFQIVAVEADWPDAATIDRYVRHRPRREGEEAAFRRFPTWMWRNTDVDAFIRWLKRRNEGCDPAAMTGFYGLDLYNLSGSMRAVIDYLEDVDPEAAKIARERYGCLAPWGRDPQAYGRMAITQGYARCERPVVEMLTELLRKRMEYVAADGDAWLDAAGNARLVKNAERYYRIMYHGAAESWNLRDTHMFEALCQLLDAKGPAAKAIVWAHNSHVGNAAFTEMGRVREELNVGQLCKERFGDQARLIGFGTHDGTVAAATDWDGPMEVKQVTPSLDGSYERLCHETGFERFLLDLREGNNDEARRALLEARLERFIGVIYRPNAERWSHYAEATLPRQFDAWVWFDRTRAVTPLPGPQIAGEDETYPFGL